VLQEHWIEPAIASNCYETNFSKGRVAEDSLERFLTEHHAMMAYCESGGTAPRILDLGTGLKWEVNFMPRTLYLQGKRPWHPLA